MKKHYGGLFVIVALLVAVCCIYGSGVSSVRKHTKDGQANSTGVIASIDEQASENLELSLGNGGMVTIEDEAVPAADMLAAGEQVTTEETSDVGSSILFLISGLLLLIVVVVVVIVATVAASTTVIEKF